MSRREEEMTIYSKKVDVRGREGTAYVYANRDKMHRAIGMHVMSSSPSTLVEVRVEVEWSDSDEAKEKQPDWVGSPAYPEWPPEERGN